MSICRNVSDRLGIEKEITSPSPFGICTAPTIIATTVVARMLRIKAPFTFRAVKTAARMRPAIARMGPGVIIFPRATVVPSLATIIPAFFIPIKVMNKPIPTPIADCKTSGTDSMTFFRIPVIARIKKVTPDINTAPNAVCHVNPIPRTTVYVKNATSPSPGATAIGMLASTAYSSVAIMLEKITAAIAASFGIPVSESVPGTTKMI
ncbi:hypothetical protein D1872_196140 [compost metagenome]